MPPSGITFDSFSSGGTGTCQSATGGFTCTGGSLISGAGDSYTIHVSVASSVADSTPTAQVTVASNGTTDPTPGDDTNTAGVTIVTAANLDLSLASAPANVFANTDPTKNTVTYTLTVQNNGYSDAKNVVLNDTLPTGLINGTACQVVNPGDCSSAADFGSYSGSFSLGTLASGASAEVLITAQADPSLRPSSPPSSQVFSDSATVTSSTQSLDSADPGQNTVPADSRSAGPVTTTYDTVPGQAQNVTVAAGNAATSIAGILTWSAPSLDGGHAAGAAPVTQYLVTVNKVGAPSTSATQYTIPATASQVICPEKATTACYTLNLPGQGLAHALANGTAYTVTVQAQNVVGSSDAVAQNVTPTLDATASLVGTTGQTLTTCTTATSAHPTCVQYTIPSGTGGVFGVQGNIGLPAGFCSGTCAAGTGALSLGALNAFMNPHNPIAETITWDASTINLALYDPKGMKTCANNSTSINCYPNDVPVFYETAGNLALGQPATELNLHFCATAKPVGAGNVNYARAMPYTDSAGSACIKKMNILGSKSNPGANGDIQVQLNVTSDSDALAGHH